MCSTCSASSDGSGFLRLSTSARSRATASSSCSLEATRRSMPIRCCCCSDESLRGVKGCAEATWSSTSSTVSPCSRARSRSVLLDLAAPPLSPTASSVAEPSSFAITRGSLPALRALAADSPAALAASGDLPLLASSPAASTTLLPERMALPAASPAAFAFSGEAPESRAACVAFAAAATSLATSIGDMPRPRAATARSAATLAASGDMPSLSTFCAAFCAA
mmetsp:Transcript_25070/g.80892  ORF Transcript_25070/g.80892 Transcript_25070/m.80892 type:complete len:222 (-) Transcript_25070:311-976(-)